MPATRLLGVYNRVGYVVVDKDGVKHERRLQSEEPMATINRILGRSRSRRQQPQPKPNPNDTDSESEDDEFEYSAPPSTSTPSIGLSPGSGAHINPSTTTTHSIPPFTPAALAASEPSKSMAMPPSPLAEQSSGDTSPISQTTEHLLIAAGSIGATIIIVMVVLAIYTMRKRGLSMRDVVQQGKQQFHHGPPPQLSSRYGQDKKYAFDDERGYGMNDRIDPPRPAAIPVRSSSTSSQKRLQPLGRSDSFSQPATRDGNQSFFDDALSHDDNQTPVSPSFPIEGKRRSASTRNTRSLDNDEDLQFADTPSRPPSNLPAPPSFRQFLSNRPSISQRPGFGAAAGMASRFSWTNSQAPQTPHDPSRDTVAQSVARESFMTSRSSVPRFRTVDSWVNQQSNRVEEQRLKQQFRMTQSTTYSDDDIPEMPALPSSVPKNANGITRQPSTKSGLVGRDIKHQRHDTQTTAPIFKAHPGTEVRFSTRSAVPSEILDRGRENAAL
ncbi:hypothetical protein COCC4DRAFT_42060 [Bipolaris maydis ATCC 48331]|uniref:Uncharacterized protein n=2 Tax=Cochliobolus heterostrophus TaxID=5016 RepID=M2SRQ9_COCH5|nr:uncharacterized protein COCC4DRAFT_42060 [Bipolaris maydis ATCC 48331]EMD87995.1 hypothetical protein COCHEDRAFT_1033354 [Bipolaris maydis C5]KAH7552224.1 hypothetical protein BM1_09086 [Bipolaris maydis]ENI03511.1 hypothetical protein COCC4DRAFT_42060 [Bipolaris maydis ATCC 48331]KAJ5024265.1 hypothetical protein J3E73DRAFT_8623 [Bipolaris maydis]KAJ5057668.1 hypothetical protein J3E74DRAFT_9398 [Bipolaris maydis]